MTDTTATDAATGDGPTADDGGARPASDDARLDRFDAALAQIGHRPSGADRRWALGGLLAMAVGIAITIVAYVTSTSLADTRDVISSVILAGVGIAVVIAGAAVFVRYSLSQFLRFWLLRMLLDRSTADE